MEIKKSSFDKEGLICISLEVANATRSAILAASHLNRNFGQAVEIILNQAGKVVITCMGKLHQHPVPYDINPLREQGQLIFIKLSVFRKTLNS